MATAFILQFLRFTVVTRCLLIFSSFFLVIYNLFSLVFPIPLDIFVFTSQIFLFAVPVCLSKNVNFANFHSVFFRHISFSWSSFYC